MQKSDRDETINKLAVHFMFVPSLLWNLQKNKHSLNINALLPFSASTLGYLIGRPHLRFTITPVFVSVLASAFAHTYARFEGVTLSSIATLAVFWKSSCT